MKNKPETNYRKYRDGYRKNFINKFLKQIEQGESFTIFGMPGTGKNDLFQNFAKNRDFWQSIYPKNAFNFLIIYIDLKKLLDVSPLGFYRLLISTINKTVGINIRDKKATDEINQIYIQAIKSKEVFSIFESCEEIINIITEKTNFKLCILIYDIATLSSFDKQFFNSLKALRNVSVWKIILAFASDSNLLKTMGPNLLGDLYSLIQNKNIWLELPNKNDSILIMEEWERANNYKIPIKVKNKFYEIANGHPGYMKYLNNIYQDKKNTLLLKNIKKISNNPSIIARGDKFWIKLNKEYRKILIELRRNHRSKIKPIYLYKTGIINKNKKLFSELLGEYIDQKKVTEDTTRKKSVNSKNHGIYIDIKNNTTYINNEKIKHELTENEFKILLYLYKTKGNIVSKDEIAKILWKNEALEKYSDWAIDKTVSRLRKKIGDSARNPKFIETVKGRGLRLLD